jgi:site-specific recombinase XerD
MDVEQSGAVWTYTPESHKTEHHGKARSIFIGPEAQKVLKKYLERPAARFCFDPAETDAARRVKLSRMFNAAFSSGATVATSRPRTRKQAPKFAAKYNTRTYGCAVRRAAKRAGCETWSPNRLRHSFATYVRKKFGLEAAQVLLGHASADVTQVYAERDHELAARVVKKVG